MYTWPTTLRLPEPTLKLVYLDLNHWIALAKALARHREGARYSEALAACIAAVDRGAAAFPISDSIYIEVSKIRQRRQRRDLREVIELVSRYVVITSRSVITVHEIESLLDRLVGPNPEPINKMNYLDWGVFRAFGLAGGVRIKSCNGDDVTEDVRSRYPHGPEVFDRVLANTERELNRKMVEGPTVEEARRREVHSGCRPTVWLGEVPFGSKNGRSHPESSGQDKLSEGVIGWRATTGPTAAGDDLLLLSSSPRPPYQGDGPAW